MPESMSRPWKDSNNQVPSSSMAGPRRAPVLRSGRTAKAFSVAPNSNSPCAFPTRRTAYYHNHDVTLYISLVIDKATMALERHRASHAKLSSHSGPQSVSLQAYASVSGRWPRR